MDRQYRDVPRFDQRMMMPAYLRMQEVQRQAAQVRLARLADRERMTALARLLAVARHIRHLPWARIRRSPGAGTIRPADRPVPASEA